MGSKINGDTLRFVKDFIDVMIKHPCLPEIIAVDSFDMTALNAISTLLDWASPPSKVLALCEEHFTKAAAEQTRENWILAPFTHEKGRKILEAIRENAKKRESASDILEKLDDFSQKIQAAKLLDNETSIVEGNQSKFSSEYGQLLKNTFTTLNATAAKALKGSDKDIVVQLKNTMFGAVAVVVEAFVIYDLVPYMEAAAKAADDKNFDSLAESCINDDSCIVHVQGTYHEKQVLALVEFGKKVGAHCSKLKAVLSSELDPVGCQKATEDWNKATCDVLGVFIEGDEITNLKNAIGLLSTSSSSLMQTNIGAHVSTHIAKRMEIALKAAKAEADSLINDDDAKTFASHLEQASLMSSVMSTGASVRAGLQFLERAIGCELRFREMFDDMDKANVSEGTADAAQLVALSGGFKLSECLNGGDGDVALGDETKQQLKSLVDALCVPEQENFQDFIGEINSHARRVASRTVDYFKALQENCAKQAAKIDQPEVTLPSEFGDVGEDVPKVWDLADLIDATFTADKLRLVSEVSCSVQDLLETLAFYESKVESKTANDFYQNVPAMEALQRACLSWLWLEY